MPADRMLPKARNPLMEEDHTPTMDTLIERRRLGQTNLAVRTGQAGLISATKMERLGNFDYAHLRVPLPRNLADSEIFGRNEEGEFPESYFLMRRSNDGFISATGMFKAAFPWATLKEEDAERRYHKQLPSGGSEEVAGNVWVAPMDALILAEEYSIRAWIEALLDPAAIKKGTTKDKDKAKIEIATPPRFVLPEKGSILPPQQATPSARPRRELRSASPTKSTSIAARKIATPRKPRASRAKAKPVENGVANDSAAEKTESVASEPPASELAVSKPTAENTEAVRVEVDETVQKNGEIETITTSVKVDMPANHPELPLPEDTEKLIEKAKEMVEQANELKAAESNGVVASTKKRKADDVEETKESTEASAEQQPTKKARKLEQALRTEKIQRRALVGTGTAMAIGAVASYFLWF